MGNVFDRIAVLVPAFNAQTSVGALLAKLLTKVPPSHIVVVDDGSTDGTGDLARQIGVRVVTHATNLGKGKALRTGFDLLKGDEHIDAVLTIDADLQHRPEDLGTFVDAMESTNGDVVVGRRNRSGTSMPVHRRLSNAITSFLVSARTASPVPDSQCGFRLIRRRVLLDVAIESAGFEAETEFLIKVIRKGYKVEFVPIETIYNGQVSHMRNWTTILSFIRTIFKEF
jgi:glycosyltransferase involved in cell wall biosynthesis